MAQQQQRGLSSYVTNQSAVPQRQPPPGVPGAMPGGVAGLTPEAKEQMIKQMQLQLQYRQSMGGANAPAGAVPTAEQLSQALTNAYASYGTGGGSVPAPGQQQVVSGHLVPHGYGIQTQGQGAISGTKAKAVRPRSAYDEYLAESKTRWKEANPDKPMDLKEIRKTAKSTFAVLTPAVKQIFEARAESWNRQKVAEGVEMGPVPKTGIRAATPPPRGANYGPFGMLPPADAEVLPRPWNPTAGLLSLPSR
jgi:hypothetical protein